MEEEGEFDDFFDDDDEDEERLVLCTANDVVVNVDVKDDEIIILFVVGTFITKAIAYPRCNDPDDDGFIIILLILDDIIIIIKSSRRELHRLLIGFVVLDDNE